MDYIPGVTENFLPENKLSPEREVELKAHLKECEVPFLTCHLCRELYNNIGYQAYAKLIEEAGPTESESLI